jgi:hypothetical protein
LITFADGPAMGRILHLRRAPLLLRVVILGAAIDALDLLTDEPQACEQVVIVYRAVEVRRYVHVKAVGPTNGWWARCRYEMVPQHQQPKPVIVRRKEAWREWCRQNARLLCGEVWDRWNLERKECA